MALFQRVVFLLFILMQSTLKSIEAAAAVSFQFLQSYVSIQSEIDNFTSQLTRDLRTKYNFNSQQISSVQISAANTGVIQINFDLNIDTRNSSQLSQRAQLQRDLSEATYLFTYTNATGARRVFQVDSGSSSVQPSVSDWWHQYSPDILYAILVGLVVFALFCIAVHCILARQRKLKKLTNQSARRTNNHLTGIDNEGYVTEMTEVYRIKGTPSSPIPDQSLKTTSFTEPVISDSSQELPLPPPSPRSPATPNSTNPTSPTHVIPQSTAKTTRAPLRASVTTSTSPTLDSFKHKSPPASPRFSQKIMSLQQGSVRSLPQLLGISTNTTPSSSRRTSVSGPSIFARLLYASYSVPPKKIHDFI